MLRPKLNRVWTSNNANLRRDPGDAKYLQGWIAEIPTFQVLNYLQYKVDTTLLALAERGVFEWGTDVQYGLGSLVWDDATRTVYVATVGSPSRTLRPSENLGQWAASAIQVSRYDYDDIVSKISAHIADTTSNPHRLTANMIGAYNKAQIDSLISQYNALVASHANDRNNPHKVTAAQAGAVPVTGGTYTGPVTFQQGMLFDVSGTSKLSFGPAGLYMQSGDERIGLDASGVPVVGKASTNTNSRIITDATFAEVKAREEPKYAVPAPNFCQHLIGDFNINSGKGAINASDSLYFNNNYGGALYRTAGQDVRETLYEGAGYGFTDCTICVDVLSNSPRAPSSDDSVGVFFSLNGLNSENIDFYLQNKGQLNLNRNASGASDWIYYNLPNRVNRWYRIAATLSTTTGLEIYVDGVRVASDASQNGAAACVGRYPQIHFQPTSRNYAVRNFRVWDFKMTPNQISTL
ncbi:hypothetical protein [Escherichia phage Ecp_YSF]|nr:hypothetical protein [Escherichia phage Ecp_YSF]